MTSPALLDARLNRRLASALRYLAVAARGGVRPVGESWDVVVTRAGPSGTALLRSMDHHARPHRHCASVIADPSSQLLMWLVPLGTMRIWPNNHGLCLGSGEISVPPVSRNHPLPRTSAPYWVRPMHQHCLVSPPVLDRELAVAVLGEPRPNIVDLLPSRANAP
ncbi:hypothetical protein [Streptomyces sp. RTd22]|uniref:hypothetical protein n=1 Tax=Streptomyces sp. RTd22 TaxID=1841249 RepID=UPI000B21CCFE|nr:hypothetical protein [Streptomyces sp. RTd22]